MRVLSLANGVVGVLQAAVLAIHVIGQAYAKVAIIEPKSGVKQVDRLLSNTGIDVFHSLRSWKAGLDRYLKVNTVKRRTHSLYRQGLYWCDCIPRCARTGFGPS